MTVVSLLAQTEYNAANPTHFRVLSTIFRRLTNTKDAKGTGVLMTGSHWEQIGFQHTNPGSDLNRSGSHKMAVLLQVLYFLQSNQQMAQEIYQLSWALGVM